MDPQNKIQTAEQVPLGQRLGGYSDALRSPDPLVAFLYLLGRDVLPLGRIETLVDVASRSARHGGCQFSNDFLAAYAMECAGRLRGENDVQARDTARTALS